MRYAAVLSKEGKRTLIDFPDCPGCSTFAESEEDIAATAAEALEVWLESRLESGDAPERPSTKRRPGRVLLIDVPLRLSVKLLVRWARHDAKLTQGDLAKRAGVSQQAIAKLEHPDANPTIETLDRVAAALNLHWNPKLVAEPKRKAG